MAADPPILTQTLLAEEGEALREAMEAVRLDDGEILFRRGDPGDAFYVIETGQVRIFTLDEAGRELTLNTMAAGEAFGELALLDDQPRSASAAAIGPTTLRRLRREDFIARLHTSPTLTATAIRLLSQRARHMTDYIEWLGQWARLVAEGHYDNVMKSIQDVGGETDRALAAVADAVKSMVSAVREREETLRQEVADLRIQVDDTKRKQQVEEIVESEYFQDLAKQVQHLRKRRKE